MGVYEKLFKINDTTELPMVTFNVKEEFLKSLEEVKVAENQLRFCDNIFMEAMIYNYNSACAKRDALHKLARQVEQVEVLKGVY